MNDPRRTLLPVAAALFLVASTPLVAQAPSQSALPDRPRSTVGFFGDPRAFPGGLGGPLAAAKAVASRPALQVAFELDGKPIQVRIGADSEVEVTTNGDAFDPERLQHLDAPGALLSGRLMILDTDRQPAVALDLRGDAMTVRFLPRSHAAWLGVDVRPLGPALAGHLELDARQHALVVAVRPDSPAARAGLQQHDVLVAIDGDGPVTHDRLAQELGDRSPGDALPLTVVRRGERIDLVVELGRAPVSSVSPIGSQLFWLNGGAQGAPDALRPRAWLDAQGRLVREKSEADAVADGGTGIAGLTQEGQVAGPESGSENLASRIERIEATLLQLEKLLARLEKQKKDA